MHERPDAAISALTAPARRMIFTSSSGLLTLLAAQELRIEGPPVPQRPSDAAPPRHGRELLLERARKAGAVRMPD